MVSERRINGKQCWEWSEKEQFYLLWQGSNKAEQWYTIYSNLSPSFRVKGILCRKQVSTCNTQVIQILKLSKCLPMTQWFPTEVQEN